MPVPVGEGFRGPEGRVGYLLRQAQHALRLAIGPALRDVGITAAQFQVLGVIRAEPGLSGAALARDSMLTPQSTNEIVVALERAGLLERFPDPSDRRTRRIRLTARGERAIAAGSERVHALEDRMVAQLTDDEQRQLRRWLVSCATALDPELPP